MLKGFDENGNMQNVKVSEDGEVFVKTSGENTGNTTTQAEITNTEANPVPVEIKNQQTIPNEIKINNTTENAIPVSIQGIETETTLNASVQNVGTEATTIAINKKVTQIDIANYSEEANVTLNAGGISAVIGANIATTIKLNKQIDNISLVSTIANTKVQLVISGVE